MVDLMSRGKKYRPAHLCEKLRKLGLVIVVIAR